MMKSIKRICAIDSLYTLLQYLLLSSEDEVMSTFFFWRDGVSPEVKRYFHGQSATIGRNFSFFKRLLWYYVIVPFRWPFVLKKNIERFACDNLGHEFLFIRKYDFSLLEDGLLSYIPYPFKWKKERFTRLKTFLFGPLFHPKKIVGDENTCKKIFLTGLKSSTILNDSRTTVNRIPDMWNQASLQKKAFIKNVFGLTDAVLEKLENCKNILLTQPFSEDSILTEEEKIDLYKRMFFSMEKGNLVIKTHPREKTDYEKFFPNAVVLSMKVPMQLISLCGVTFERAYTVCTTAAFDFPYPIKVYYTGSDVSKILLNKMPHCALSKIGEIPSHVDFVPWEIV